MDELQAALDAIESSRGDTDPLIVAKARGLMIGYHHRWQHHKMEVVSVEETYHLPVVNPATGRTSRTFTQGGKFDGVVKVGSETFLLEHKTSAEDIADPDSTYWRRLAIDSQVSHYVMANWMKGRKVDGTLYDVLKKPGIKPRQLTKAEQQEIAEQGTYFGFVVSSPKIRSGVDTHIKHVAWCKEKIAAHKKEQKKIEKDGGVATPVPEYYEDGASATISESLELYEMRLARDCIDNGLEYFQRRVIHRLDSDIAEHANEVWEACESLKHARANNSHYRNSGACIQFNSPCEYLGVCSGYDQIDSPNWEIAENVHSELDLVADNGGRNLMTNSRLKCFMTCRRKHFYRYELGARRVGGEDKEALVLGSLVHAGLEAYLNFRKDCEYASSNSTAAVE